MPLIIYHLVTGSRDSAPPRITSMIHSFLVCVCVNHLNRCKTSTCLCCRFEFAVFSLFPNKCQLFTCFSRGAQKAHRAVPNEALYGVLRISRLITWTYLHISGYFRHGKGLSQEPSRRHYLFSTISCMAAAICNLFSVFGFHIQSEL